MSKRKPTPQAAADRLPHGKLAEDLAAHLGGESVMTWCDIQLGSAHSVRPDVYTIRKSFVNPNPMAYECKVSRGDFLADVTAGKWQAYLQYACGVVFAAEADLLSKADVPPHCGLILRHPTGTWRLAKRPVLNPVTIPQDALIKLLIDGVEREGPRMRARVWKDGTYYDQYKARFGEIVARTIADRIGVEREIESARRTAERILEDAHTRAEYVKKEAVDSFAPMRAELCEALGLPPDTDRYKIRAAISGFKDALKEHPAQEALRILTTHLRNSLNLYGYKPAAQETDAA